MGELEEWKGAERLTLRIQATATRITAVPGPLMRRTSTHGSFHRLTSGMRKVCHRDMIRVLVADDIVDLRDSPTLRARGSANIVCV